MDVLGMRQCMYWEEALGNVCTGEEVLGNICTGEEAMYVLGRRVLLTWSRYCGISSTSRLEMATEISEGFMMHAFPECVCVCGGGGRRG